MSEIDGVRGLANEFLTLEFTIQFDQATARVLMGGIPISQLSRTGRPRVVVGRDTRASGEFLDHAISAGLASLGVGVTCIGVLPTPAIVRLIATQNADLGTVISASHNLLQGNGIRFSGRGGYKLDDASEDQVEVPFDKVEQLPTGVAVGRVIKGETVIDQNYINHLVDSVGTDLPGLWIVVDTPNGAANHVGPTVLQVTGAEVTVTSASPDGLSINAYRGSTHPEQFQKYVVAVHVDMGVAYDGDTDRCLAVDAEREPVDGDQTTGFLIVRTKIDGTLGSDALVVTVMSNLGLFLAVKEHGIHTVQTGVGDRYILERILQGGYTLGGGQSGHVTDMIHATMGDGVLTSFRIAAWMKCTDKSLAELASIIQHFPQTLVNIEGVDKACASTNAAVQKAVEEAEAEFGKSRRALLCPSDTEPFVQVMVEAATREQADKVAGRPAEVVKNNLVLQGTGWCFQKQVGILRVARTGLVRSEGSV